MKIVIVGGGFAGFSAYLALRKHLPHGGDHEYTIYEAYDATVKSITGELPMGDTHGASLTVGGGVGISANGLNVMKRLDEELFHDVVRAGYPHPYYEFRNAWGWKLMRSPTTSTGAGDDEPPIHSVMVRRHAVWNCFRRRVPDDVIVQKKVSVVVTNKRGRNVVKFADGSPDVEADLVIGADGLKSTVRRAIFTDGNRGGDPYPPHYEGFVGVGGFIPASSVSHSADLSADAMTFVFGKDGFFGYGFADSDPQDPDRHLPHGAVAPGDTVGWWSTYFVEPCPDLKTIDKEDIVRQLCKRHGNWKNEVVQQVIRSVKVDTMWPVWTTPSLPTWEKDGVVLMGDAAHALPPTSGQGSSQAFEDVEAFSLFLAHYLERAYRESEGGNTQEHEHDHAKAAIKLAGQKYMELRQPRVNAILSHARRMDTKKRDLNLVVEMMLYLFFFVKGFLPRDQMFLQLVNYNPAAEVKKVLAAEKD